MNADEPNENFQEVERLAALDRYEILDTLPEDAFNDIVWLAAQTLSVPIAAINFVDAQRQWSKACLGTATLTAVRSQSFCVHVVHHRETVVVEDAAGHPGFHDNSFVTGDPGIRFYAGAPIITPDGHVLGSLCIIDHQPRTLTPSERAVLERLAGLVTGELELRLANKKLHGKQQLLERAAEQLRSALQLARRSDQLARQTQELRALNEELEAFSYSVSHDLRTPLRHIDGYAELLERQLGEHLDDRAARTLGVIKDSSRRMNNLIDALLKFAQLGRQPLRLGEVNLTDVVTAVLQDLAPDYQDRRVTWRTAPLPTVLGDGPLLRLVLENLLSNALKYTRNEPHAVIEVTSAETSEEHVISIRDNGVGFPAQYADHLFGVFQRLHSNREFEGTGVGLANVRRIVHRHGGRVWADGQIGAGALFSFSLPKRAPSREP